jgi:enamine deaminase RidA (YjgF/YER057c/UK114 family)
MTDDLTTINPAALGAARGFSHGVLAAEGARMLFVAGQTAADANGRVVDRAFVAQFAASLDKIVTVVRAAGGGPEHVARMTVYVTDMDAYLESRKELRDVWHHRMGAHYPAMALVAVARLVDADAAVEIEATAVLPAKAGSHS